MFIKNEPAMKLKSSLIVADIHLGITRQMMENGILLPSQAAGMADKINMLGQRTKSRNLVLLGDVKHKVPGTSYQEMKEIPEFLDKLKFKKITIVKGNHDGNIERLVDGKANIVKSVRISGWLLTHGHMSSNAKKIIIGHNHPCVYFVDQMKARYTEKVWVHYVGKKEIIWMPAFNELCGCAVINNDAAGLGPIARKMDLAQARAFLLDGTDIGIVSNLKRVDMDGV